MTTGGSSQASATRDARTLKRPNQTPLIDLKRRLMAWSREKKIRHFYSLCSEPQKILDVGVSQDRQGVLPAQNYFLKTFRYASSLYTGLGIEDLSALEQKYPDKRFVRYGGKVFPFADKEFDWAFSNAVVEHVGSEADQLRFINEMLRVARQVFFTTPNKYFPIESHTHALFRHWSDERFYAWCARRTPWWTRKNLYLFSRSRLESVMRRSNAAHYEIHTGRLLGWPMTFTVICRA